MNLETVQRYFKEDDMYCCFTSEHPLKKHFDACEGFAFVKRTDKDILEIVFRCTQFGGGHIVRECHDNCSKFAVCQQISTVLEKEAILEALYPVTSE